MVGWLVISPRDMPRSISDILYRIYRAKILFALDKDLNEELSWLNDVSLKYLKNYQIWYVDHRQAPTPESHEREKAREKKSPKTNLTTQTGTTAKSCYHQKHTFQHSHPKKQTS